MTDQSDQPQGDSRFRALLTPHRSLGPKGFLVLMGVICAVNFFVGLMFFLLGAWPVIGFCGLDVALIYFAFRASYRSGRLVEEIALREDSLTVTRLWPSGRSQSWRFNPYWVRVKVEPRVGRSSEMSIGSHGRRLVIGSFLTDEEREDFAGALREALARAPGIQEAATKLA